MPLDNGLVRTWIVAHDFSPHADAALSAALKELLELPGPARLVIVHVMQRAPILTGELATLGPTFAEMQREARKKVGERLVKVAGATAAEAQGRGKQVTVDPVVRSGAATDEILEEAEERNAERIIVGTQGRRGLGRLLLGSVAEVVARRSKSRCSWCTRWARSKRKGLPSRTNPW